MNTKCPYSKDGICTVCNILKIRCEEEPRFFLCYEYNKEKRAEQIRLKKTIMCKYDEAFTEKEMLEETGFCKCCKLDCPNAGK